MAIDDVAVDDRNEARNGLTLVQKIVITGFLVAFGASPLAIPSMLYANRKSLKRSLDETAAAIAEKYNVPKIPIGREDFIIGEDKFSTVDDVNIERQFDAVITYRGVPYRIQYVHTGFWAEIPNWKPVEITRLTPQ